jgi:hypothetical protein
VNLFVPARYAETVTPLAYGIELLDPTRAPGARFTGPVTVLDERRPQPLAAWRRWPPGSTLDDALTPVTRHRSGRFARIGPAAGALTIRVVEPRAGASRALVPRRLRLATGGVYRLVLFPGAGGAPGPGATVLRGRVTRPGDVPVRWTRVVARDDHDDLGWAHGDDRGEFVLVVAGPADAGAMPPDPLPLHLTVTAPVAAVPPPDDPLVPAVDPLWDLPIETAVDGRTLWPTTEHGPFDVAVPLGRETLLPIALPPPPP